MPSQPTSKALPSAKVATTPCAPLSRSASFLSKAILIRRSSASSRSTWCKRDRRRLLLGAPTSALAPLRTSPRGLPFPPQHIEPIAGHIQEIVSIISGGSSGLVDLGLDACPLQEQGDDRSSDPAATNQRFSCGSVHHQESFLIISFSSLTPFRLPPQRGGKRGLDG